MIKWLIKKLTVPKSNETKQVDAVQLWYVRWISRSGDYPVHTKPAMEAFTNKKDAVDFYNALKAAQTLLQNTNYIELQLVEPKQ